MKPLWIALALFAAIIGAHAQQPKPSARLEVKTAKSGKTLNRLWGYDYYGSYDRDQLRTTFLDIRISTVGRVPFDAVMEIVFHGKHPATKQPLVAAWQTAPVRIEPNKPLRYVASSGLVKSNTTRYASIGQIYGSGTNVASWHVRLKSGETIIAEAHNGIPLDFARLPEIVSESVKQRILESDKPEESKIKSIGLNDPI
jgi:hypothetical protein